MPAKGLWMEPDVCTSLNCDNYGCDYCSKCSHSNFFGSGTDSSGKEWRWTFNPIFGPLFLRKDGSDMKRQPSEKSKAWEAFESWHNQRMERTAKSAAA
jgi:hypothetical protein